jgi:hypothetical protein
MTNPVASIRECWHGTKGEERPLHKSVYTYCPGCLQMHPFTVELYDKEARRPNGSEYPVWDWDGNLTLPTFSPSMLAYYSVHLCPPEYKHHITCGNPDSCSQPSHLVIGENRVLAHNRRHIVDPAWGNCHSFLKAGVWEFLTDSAHKLAGQKVPMIPLPDWVL